MEFVSQVPQSGSRAELLRPFTQGGAQDAFNTPVKGRICTARSKDDPMSSFKALPGLVVVRSRGFEVRDPDSDSSLTPVTNRKRKRTSSPSRGKGKGPMTRRRTAGEASLREVDDDDSDSVDVEELSGGDALDDEEEEEEEEDDD